MGCPCKNKPKQAASLKSPQRPQSPLRNGNYGTSRIMRRVVR